jgi:nucleotide-binding universal stress UspA family protein
MAGLILGYDGSPGSKAALAVARDLAKALGEPVHVAFCYASNPAGGENQDLERTVAGMGQAAVDEALAVLAAAGVTAESALIHDRPAEGLLWLASERSARMIVVGSNGEGPVVGAILGSVPYKLVHRSAIPTVVVPPER